MRLPGPVWIAVLIAGLLLPCAAIPAQETARGVVFEDINANGVRDAGEKGLPGVCVSNGESVAVTDDKGVFTLPVRGAAPIFVVKPAGWSVPVDGSQRPRFFRPAAADVAAPAADFPLVKRPEPSQFTFVVWTDPQARGLKEVDYVARDVVPELIGVEAAFGVTLGDLVADDPELMGAVSAVTGQIGIPWYNVMGNHDYDRKATTDLDACATFERFFGPTSYAFEYGRAVFIVYRDMVFTTDGTREQFHEEELAFTRNYLAHVPADKLVVLLMHIPIMAVENKEALFALVQDRPHLFSISGHTHEQDQYYLGPKEGWQDARPHLHYIAGAVSGSWWCGTPDELGIPDATMNDGTPNGYALVHVDGDQYSFRWKVARRPAEYQMNVYLPPEVSQAAVKDTEVLVNLFAGSERCRVEMQLDGAGAWAPLAQTPGIDPACLRMYKLNEFRQDGIWGWDMDFPGITRHLWKAPLFPGIVVGVHRISVRAVDAFGQTHRGECILRVTE